MGDTKVNDTANAQHGNLPTVTDNAARRIAKILTSEPQGAMLRVAVNGGGCSGFQYAFDITAERNDDDIGIEKNGITVLIDSVSLDFLKDSKIDFVDDLIGQSFKIENPNATASCGCGTSFSL
ncbi:MAG: iron-sulfur cluster insertion protein ErpA [Beijerinckiaceae bacterium]|jgi:iron-sulfur cluster assembly accessory protein|nr:iron-sulfur cluster insertion protein ErpA [Beijerinckiaceae bacterium]